MAYKHISLAQALERARRGHYAIGAFNASSLETMKAIVQAAVSLKSPVIIEASGGEVAYMGTELLAAMAESLSQTHRVPIYVNLDHSKAEAEVKRAVNAGFDLVHYDGSEFPKTRNVAALKRVVPFAHKKGVLVEGEMDHITGSSEWHKGKRAETEQNPAMYTDPDAALAFVRATTIDIFASFIGNVHGVYANEERLNLELVKHLHRKLPCFLSLHGGSGIKAADVKDAIRYGISKVNVNTEIRIAHVTALREAFRQNPAQVKWHELTGPSIAAMQTVIAQKIRVFGSAGKA